MNNFDRNLLRVQADVDQLKAQLVAVLKEARINNTLLEAIFKMMCTEIRNQSAAAERAEKAQDTPDGIRMLVDYFRASLLSIGITSFIECLTLMEDS